MSGKIVIWHCADGRVLRMTDMEDEHLSNAAAMLRRKGFCTTDEFWLAIGGAASLRGEYAQMAAENSVADMCPSRSLDLIEAEQERRRRNGRTPAPCLRCNIFVSKQLELLH
jgi:hypothetical protein